MRVLSALLAFSASLTGAAPDTTPASCAASPVSRKVGAAPVAFVAVARAGARDTIVRATVCVALPAKTAARIGSYHGELHFDSALVSSVHVQRTPRGESGMRVENATIPGQVNFAGAAPPPAGFPAGALVSVVLRLRTPGTRPVLRLQMLELNATDGADLMKRLTTAANP